MHLNCLEPHGLRVSVQVALPIAVVPPNGWVIAQCALPFNGSLKSGEMVHFLTLSAAPLPLLIAEGELGGMVVTWLSVFRAARACATMPAVAPARSYASVEPSKHAFVAAIAATRVHAATTDG